MRRQGRRYHFQRHRGRVDAHPTTWNMAYFNTLLDFEWKLVKSPAGAHQWIPTDPEPPSSYLTHTTPKNARAHDDHGGYVAADRPQILKDLQRFRTTPRVRGRLCPAWFKLPTAIWPALPLP
jgi:catalase-peroxidase